ncbi:ROK family protein [Halobacillus shinanisalinarum]|uniref:ROK family protein n=1 Tax=Halobacillus shinanisalinarum TaxID=2932258 RepID=A0ABY4GUM4_9BACI|nr:ROK family transcriptional regulator [Halobacillus shinanisalinarum]UOQ91823.1 ROK family protein [Halobacillus shinanisalinarum]
MNKLKTWNQNTIRNGNKSLVLKSIMTHAPISRAEIAKKTGLNKGTVSSQVTELLKEDLIYEKGPGESSGGRRPVMLLFNRHAGYCIGIDIGVNYILGILTDLEGNVCEETSTTFHQLSYENINEKLFEIVDFLITASPQSPYEIVGIGIGVPGAVNNDGKILLSPNLGWQNVNLKQLINEKYNCPVIIENEANAGAYGEKKFGVGKEGKDIVYVSVGVGIGVGLVLNGKLYRGSNGFSGELGHMTIEVNGAKCQCGNKGCWELYASEKALINYAHKMGYTREQDTLEKMIRLTNGGNVDMIKSFQTIGAYLGIGITNIINTFNPEKVIIGNRLVAAKQWIKEPLLEKTQNNALWFQKDDVNVCFSELHKHATALGVSAFTVENFLKVDILQD